jgi:hypothetical protein
VFNLGYAYPGGKQIHLTGYFQLKKYIVISTDYSGTGLGSGLATGDLDVGTFLTLYNFALLKWPWSFVNFYMILINMSFYVVYLVLFRCSLQSVHKLNYAPITRGVQWCRAISSEGTKQRRLKTSDLRAFCELLNVITVHVITAFNTTSYKHHTQIFNCPIYAGY